MSAGEEGNCPSKGMEDEPACRASGDTGAGSAETRPVQENARCTDRAQACGNKWS